jgi:predicted nucleotidyltransferase
MKFINILKKPNIRKLFGKRELIIIEKQLKGVKLKPSEKTRLSRDIRAKFKAIKELIPYEEEFKLKYKEKIKEKIKNLKKTILESKYHPNIKKIILFGSITENQLTLESDIDIAVEFKKINSKEATEFRIKILGRIEENIDIQVYNTLPKKIKKEIDKKGKIIYERKNK